MLEGATMPRPRPALALCRTAVAALALVGCTSAEPPPAPSSEQEPAAPVAVAVSDEPVRIKGLAPRLLIHRQRDGAIEQLGDGAMAQAGDLVQISYMAAGNRHGVVISLDGSGGVTLHHPSVPDAPAPLVVRGQHALDHAYELDDAEDYERFVFVTSGDEAIQPAVVIAAARRLARGGPAARHSPLPLPERWQQSSITLNKPR